jgi:ribosome-binding factor A
MRKTRRTSKVGENVRDALVDVFRYDVKDINLGLTSIMDVEVSPDLHLARVFMSGLKEEETREIVKALQNAKGKIRHHLGKRIRLRYTPELEFKYDETPLRAGRVEDLLAEIKKQESSRTDDDDQSNDNDD